MKNLITTGLCAFILTATLFSCNKPAEPQPAQVAEAKQDEADSNGKQAKLNSRFKWEFAKTGVFGNGQKLRLQAPFAMGYMFGGDITFNKFVDDAAFMPLTVKFFNLGKIDKNTVDPADLNTKRFNSNKIWAPDANGATQADEFDSNTIIAVRNTDGQYFLIEVVKLLGYEVEVNIYQESYVTGQARLPYELPDGFQANQKK